MRIRYTGNKPKKVISYVGKEIVFAPTAEFNEVYDIDLIKWLLDKDKLGLFVVEDNKDDTASVVVPEATEKPKEEVREEALKPKRGRRPKKR